MTAQVSDLFMFQGRSFDLAGISEGDIFSPELLGIHPVGASTACYRGYQAVFAVRGFRLVLKTLYASLYAEGPERYTPLIGPPINGVIPVSGEEHDQFNNIYKNVRYPLPYSGGVLIAAAFINDLYEHMGFHPPWKYRDVWELVFEDGGLTKAIDCSKRMAEARERILSMRQDDSATEDQTNALYAWIEKSFDRSYYQ